MDDMLTPTGKIKGRMSDRKIYGAAIARRLKVSRQAVHRTITGEMVSARIRETLSEELGLDPLIWEEIDRLWGRAA